MRQAVWLGVAAVAVVGAGVAAFALRDRGPSAEALGLAQTLVAETDSGGLATLNGIVPPFPHLMAEMGITDRRQFRAVVDSAFVPTLGDHADDLTGIQVKSYATLLSVDDLKAANAFYASAAGQDLIKLRYKVQQKNAAGLHELLETLKPEITKKTQDALAAHG